MSLPREISKTKLSLYLRTQCDRELYLSLFKGGAAKFTAAGIPAPLKSRPNVQLVTGAGHDFENDQYSMLVARIPAHVYYAQNFGTLNLATTLPVAQTPSLCIQPAIEFESFRAAFLTNLGVDSSDQPLIPRLVDMRPDLLIVRATMPDDWEIMPDGNRRRLIASDTRRALSVVDLKNVSEANSSYAAEVCLYAVALANWLVQGGLQNSFYVSAQLYLWTRPRLTSFEEFCSTHKTATAAQKIFALTEALERESIDFLQFMPSVRKFFNEDVPRVVARGDASDWSALDYHVGSRCNACDWLGHRDWLSKADEQVFDANPTHYCVPQAEASHHLSRVPNLSRGARLVLEAHAVPDVNALSALPPGAPVMTQHAFLKRERRGLANKALAIISDVMSSDNAARIITLAKNASLQINITVAFDASAGRLAGIGLHASFLPPFGSTASPAQLLRKGYLVSKDTEDAEWVVIDSFIEALVGAVDAAAARIDPQRKPDPNAQIYFWEMRQYEELCKAFGRHLPRVLALKATRRQALAWLFPAEDLLEREDGAISPAIVFVQEIVERVLHLPVTHVSTLKQVSDVYYHPKLVPNPVDTFYSEPFSNGIPRERTFEIWMNTSGAVSWGAHVKIPLPDAMDRYRRVLANNAFALGSVVARLRSDFKTLIKGSARPLVLSTITGRTGVAFDSKLWSQWKRLDQATDAMKTAAELASSGERLESAYKGIVLTRLKRHLGGYRYEFEVSAESLEAKIDAPHRYLTIGVMSRPGFPLENGYSLGLQAHDATLQPNQLKPAMHRVIAASLLEFDRTKRSATIELSSWGALQQTLNVIMTSGVIDVRRDQLVLLEKAPYDDTAITERILDAIGDPSNATPDTNAIRTLGKAGKSIKIGKDLPSKSSRVLWQADSEAAHAKRSPGAADRIAAVAAKVAGDGLNASQRAAVKVAAAQALSILWGPPGTGKTGTLAALVYAMIEEVATLGIGRKILLSGPNYRAVEVLAQRVCAALAGDPSATCDFFVAYSKSRELPPPLTLPAHVSGGNVALGFGLTGYTDLQKSLADSFRVTVVATTAHAVDKVADLIDDTQALVPAFDVVIIDEASQVDVTLALRPIATLKPEGQLIVAGDHLQMPPIVAVDPPLNAEYLVGSIQTYFIKRFNIAWQPLLINYRSNQAIVDYALSLGYPRGLRASEPNRRLNECVSRSLALASLPASLPNSGAWDLLLDPAKPVCCLIHEDETASQANAAEAKMVAALVYGLHKSMSRQLEPLNPLEFHALMSEAELFDLGVGIVTPHKAQRAAVLTELGRLYPSVSRETMTQSVDTVERFQGGERHTIIVSFGVGDIEVIQGEEAFLLQLERINVAVSRAMAKCIVILPKSLAYHLPSERKVLKTAKAIKSYIEEFCALRQKETLVIDGVTRSCEVRWHG